MADQFDVSLQDCFQGSPINLTFNFWVTPPNPATGYPGVPEDISGQTLMFTWKNSRSDPDSEAIYAYDETIVHGASGTYLLTIPAAITSPVPAKSLTFWDLKNIVPPLTDPVTVLAGTILLGHAITQRLAPTFTFTLAQLLRRIDELENRLRELGIAA